MGRTVGSGTSVLDVMLVNLRILWSTVVGTSGQGLGDANDLWQADLGTVAYRVEQSGDWPAPLVARTEGGVELDVLHDESAGPVLWVR
ncbi:MAG: hypothetical protein JNM72_04360 [Deltaproteobacteria bacterium]|nr:hypothetical protein [Deltaproteobacteria bacterium]